LISRGVALGCFANPRASTVNSLSPTLISLADFNPSLVNISVSPSTQAGKYGVNLGGKNGKNGGTYGAKYGGKKGGKNGKNGKNGGKKGGKNGKNGKNGGKKGGKNGKNGKNGGKKGGKKGGT